MAGLTAQMSRLTLRDSCKPVPRFEGFRSVGQAPKAAYKPAKVSFGRVPLHIQCARVANVEIPNAKRIETSLTYIFGIGPTSAKKILVATGIENKRTHELSDGELTQLREEVDKYTIEGDLRRQTALDIKRLKDIGCYRGRRHIMGLPCRGQKTKTNARQRKGKRGSPIKGKK
ncbi:hypothetical protein BSKO_07369 [Bryopsis sp. KO-2023]|nr:hypothetical protein BSKO_07369 [Bryopsis sp. KO-2023]